MRLVVDASVAVEFLLRTRVGLHVAGTLDSARLLAPELLDAEVLAVLRRETLAGRLTVARASEALVDLRDWQVARVSHRLLLEEAWKVRNNVSGYDAFYIAAARRYSAAVITADGPLARASALGVVVQNVRG